MPPLPVMAIASPRSGGFAAQEGLLSLAVDEGGIVRNISSMEELATALAEAQRLGCRRIIVVGGDGSVSRVLNALGSESAQFEVAVIPAGTGNDLARSLGIPVNDPPAAWEVALHGAPRSIDFASYRGETSGYFANSITAGFGGRQAAADVDQEQKSYLGKIAYWLAALAKIGEMPEFDVLLKADEREHHIRALGFWIANGRYVGGGFPAAPTALLDDGLLDVVVVPALPALELVAAGVDFTVSGPEQAETVLHFRSSKVVAAVVPSVPLSIDGEPVESASWECSMIPGGLRMVCGPLEPAVTATA